MAKKQMIDAVVLDILHVTVDASASEPAILGFEIEGQANLQLRLTPESLAKLEAMLANASIEQAKRNPLQ
jgi:hypothetical protein